MIRIVLLIVLTAFVFSSMAVAADLCDKSQTTVYWSLHKKPDSPNGISPSEFVDNSNFPWWLPVLGYKLVISPKCDGQINVYAHEHGSGSLDPGGRSATLRVKRDGGLACYKHVGDGFSGYNLVCNSAENPLLNYRVSAGNTTVVSFLRDNTNADPDSDEADGLRLQVTFIRDQPVPLTH